MADEGNQSRRAGRRGRMMDLNLYLGLPRSPRHTSLAVLGSDLALGSTSSTTEESPAPTAATEMSVDPPDSYALYSPSHPYYNPDLPSVDPLPPANDNPTQEFTRFCPYDLIVQEHGGLLDTLYSPDHFQQSDEDRPVHVDSPRPYSPNLYSPTSPAWAPESPPHDDVAFSMFSSVPAQPGGEPLGRNDGSSSQPQLLQFPEFRIRRLIEVNHRLRQRRFRSSLPYTSGRLDSSQPSPPVARPLTHNMMSFHRELEATGKHKGPAKHTVTDNSDEETTEKRKQAANFECNICFDMAKEPVVTSCGHLFCWPCLYQWLHLHCDHKECPVCKGEVIESNITPIYGRGSSEPTDEKKLGENEESGLKIPPRPHGNRIESFRQQYRPISRRMGEGVDTSWRRFVDQRVRNRNRFEGHGDPSLLGVHDVGHRPPMTRLRARRMQRDEGIPETASSNGEIGLPRESTSVPQSCNSTLSFREGFDLWQLFQLQGLTNSDRLAAITVDLSRVVGRFVNSTDPYVASTSSVDPQAPEQLVDRPPAAAATLAPDQTSASSTMAVIQDDVAITNASAERNGAGSSRPYRRRGRSSTSGSLDVDGALHACKRRRLN